MAFERTSGLTRSFLYFDSGGNPLAPYSPVSLLTSGLPSGYNVGEVVGLPSVASGRNTTYLVGVTLEWAYSGRQVPVQIDGIVFVIANAAVSASGIVFVAATGTRTADQAPFVNHPAIRPLVRPGQSVTMNVVLCDDVAITPQSGSANLLYYPLGIALAPATAQYDLFPVLLQTQPFYA
ncbi:MAG: hypothetical protein KatS3mg023_3892 [Armatimonadota bacterium]|nr:MAG: hypothetical protein KatS3mg023_3892 [Armatimonadota bacterium]